VIGRAHRWPIAVNWNVLTLLCAIRDVPASLLTNRGFQDGAGVITFWDCGDHLLKKAQAELDEAMLQSTGFLIDADLWRPYVEKRSECDAG
jgi:hypothetical protein